LLMTKEKVLWHLRSFHLNCEYFVMKYFLIERKTQETQ
jgi:hypothetical protein